MNLLNFCAFLFKNFCNLWNCEEQKCKKQETFFNNKYGLNIFFHVTNSIIEMKIKYFA